MVSTVKILLILIFASSAFASDWIFSRRLPQGTRGGASSGIPVNIDSSTTSTWASLQEQNISKHEKDRRAILALQGEFKASFEFMETTLLDTRLKKDIPYASWGTEIVKVIEDRGDFISLQHIMVMFFKDQGSGQTIGPVLVKHWRQDWQWEADKRIVFQGDNHWKIQKLALDETRGRWKWTVFQVDDTPRYSGLGVWNHLKSASMFSTDMMSRPLPRREFSVRSDYKLLLAMDTLVLTKNSWNHEQKNYKHINKLGVDSTMNESSLLSREIGHNTYARIKGFDFSAAYSYWTKTASYWSQVREFWDQYMSLNSELKMKETVNGVKLFAAHFKNAEDVKVLAMSVVKRKKLIKNLIESYIVRK